MAAQAYGYLNFGKNYVVHELMVQRFEIGHVVYIDEYRWVTLAKFTCLWIAGLVLLAGAPQRRKTHGQR